MNTEKNRNKEIAEFCAFPVAAAAGDGTSPTVSLKNVRNFDAFSKTWTSACADLLLLIVTIATWNQDESDSSEGCPDTPTKNKNNAGFICSEVLMFPIWK